MASEVNGRVLSDVAIELLETISFFKVIFSKSLCDFYNEKVLNSCMAMESMFSA